MLSRRAERMSGLAPLILVSLLCVGGMARGAASAIDELDDLAGKAWHELAERGLPTDDKVVVVVPFADERKAVKKLGYVAADALSIKVTKSRRARLADRANLQAVIREQDTWIDDLYEARDPRKSAETRKLLKADFLVLGTMVTGVPDIRFTLRLVESASGEVKAMSGFRLRSDASVIQYLWDKHGAREGQYRPARLQLSYSVVAQRRQPDGGVEEGAVKDGDVLRSRDQFQIHFEPACDCYVYILLFDSTGKAETLFLYPGIKLGNLCRGGVKYVVPDPESGKGARSPWTAEGAKQRWFWLNDDTGVETLYIVASYGPMRDLAALVKWMRQVGGDAAEARAKRVRKEIASYAGGEKPAPENVKPLEQAGSVEEAARFEVRLPDDRRIKQVGEVVRGVFSSLAKEIRIRHEPAHRQ